MSNDRPAEKLESRSYWRFQVFAWGFLGGYMLLYIVATPRFWYWQPIVLEVARVGVLSLISHVIVKTGWSRKWFRLTRAGLVLRGLAACALGGVVLTVVFYPLSQSAYGPSEPFDGFSPVIDYVSNTGTLVMWGGFFLASYYHDLSTRSEMDRVRLVASSKELQLSTLKNQLNPHFLFNSFNLLRALVQRDPGAARDSITHLSEMMRHSLSLARHNTISLASELEFVDAYLALERLRYEERLRVSACVPDELRLLQVPSMLLYTLVGNAVQHGIDQSLAGVHVRYTIWLEAGHLCLRVVNGGNLIKSGRSTGTGLANIRERLELLYGAEASLAIFERDQQVIAEARWPASAQEIVP